MTRRPRRRRCRRPTKVRQLVNPESFEPNEFLTTERLRKRLDDARYFVHLLYTKIADKRQKNKRKDVIRLNAKVLNQIMHGPSSAAVRKALIDGGAIERLPYKKGSHSYGYRLTKRFENDRHVYVAVTDRRLLRRLAAASKKMALKRSEHAKPVHRALSKLQRRIQIDGPGARSLLATSLAKFNKFDRQEIQVSRIERREFRWSVGRCGRFFNCLSTFKKELRTFLHVNGERLQEVDIACAQPALLAKMIEECFSENSRKRGERSAENQDKSSGADGQTEERRAGRQTAAVCNYDYSLPLIPNDFSFEVFNSPDYRRFRNLVQDGSFNDVLAMELGLSTKKFKKRFLCDVLAKKKNYSSEVENWFREHFPNVYRFIRFVNRDDHGALIRRLQRAESALVIDTVAADLVTRYPGVFFITLHDAIFSTAEHLPKVVQAFQRAFAESGFPMTLKTVGENVQTIIRPQLRENCLAADSKLHSNFGRA